MLKVMLNFIMENNFQEIENENTQDQIGTLDYIFTLDLSHSMTGTLPPLIEQLNTFFGKKKEQFANQDVYATICVFADPQHIAVIQPRVKLSEISRIPCLNTLGNTALNSAIMFVDDLITKNHEYQNGQVTHILLTDGQENTSLKEHTKEVVSEVLQGYLKSKDTDPKTAKTLIFAGANQDAIATAKSYGLTEEYALTFNLSYTQGCINALDNMITRHASGTDTTPSVSAVDRQLSCPVANDYRNSYGNDNVDTHSSDQMDDNDDTCPPLRRSATCLPYASKRQSDYIPSVFD